MDFGIYKTTVSCDLTLRVFDPLVRFFIIYLSLPCLVIAIEQNPLPVGLKSPARINEVLKLPKIIVCRNSGRSNRRNVLHLRMANREIHFGSHVGRRITKRHSNTEQRHSNTKSKTFKSCINFVSQSVRHSLLPQHFY